MNTHWASVAPVVLDVGTPSRAKAWIFLFRRRYMILGVFLALFTAATALIYLVPQTYTAKSSLLVERTRSPIMRTDYSPGLEMNEVMNTARGIASSRSVISAAVDSLKLTERPPSNTLFASLLRGVDAILRTLGLVPEVNPRDRWIESVTKWLTVTPVVNSNILTISISHDDPQLAADLVNEITNQYIKQHLKIYSTRGLAEFYRDQKDLAEKEYHAARQRIIDFKKNASLYAISASRDEYARELSTLRGQLLTSTNDLNRLTRRYDAQHPEVVVLRDTISAVEARVQETEAKLQRLERDEATLTDMELQLDTRRKTYIDYSNKYSEAAISEHADPDVVNVRQVEQAVVPPQPWIARLFLIIGAMIASLAIAIGVGLLRDYFDDRPTGPENVESALGVPVLGWLERLPATKLRSIYVESDIRRIE
ncbi:GumC family protein [Microvirga guangxiensis]|uniref:Uncharacterized protein involved in exopolysaccharide biosynthesis n=1 Tax=Microvirga guangxiensis TaxID=549386 RepID=A0A1G5H1C7_9HYPH|nr:hypothetical protein [Microvirga guangxiensis]SCY57170.1 Uncharacterized protein involved in exopolysaccharide biosynthesis [Microvirga guangxiensis]